MSWAKKLTSAPLSNFLNGVVVDIAGAVRGEHAGDDYAGIEPGESVTQLSG
jgi:hypothetical protein